MPIKWDDRLSVGNAFIDTEHKLIISTINGLESALLHPEEKELLMFFMDQLHQIAKEHFHNEEMLQIKYLYPFYEENKAGHTILMAELDDIKENIHALVENPGATPKEIKKTSERVSETLRDWVITHIIKSDLKMKGFMDSAI